MRDKQKEGNGSWINGKIRIVFSFRNRGILEWSGCAKYFREKKDKRFSANVNREARSLLLGNHKNTFFIGL